MRIGGKIALATSVATLIALPAAALANGGTGNPPGSTVSQQHRTQSTSASSSSTRSTAEKQCRSMRNTMGTATFDALFVTNKNQRNAFGKCVSEQSKQDAADQASAHSTAEKNCRSMQSSDPSGFQQQFGTNANGKNAFGKCVSSQEKALASSMEKKQIKALEKAAKTCRAMQMSDAATFAQTFGTGKNAFGKCVSQQAKTQQQTSSS